jgi:diguanylate cyclase
MRYRESKEKSLECLRLAIQMMNKQEAAAHPVSYAVWYEYVSGANAALRDQRRHPERRSPVERHQDHGAVPQTCGGHR